MYISFVAEAKLVVSLQLGHSLSHILQHFISYPIAQGRLINLIGFCTVPKAKPSRFEGRWAQDATKEEIMEEYKGWDDEVQQLIQVRAVEAMHASSCSSNG